MTKLDEILTLKKNYPKIDILVEILIPYQSPEEKESIIRALGEISEYPAQILTSPDVIITTITEVKLVCLEKQENIPHVYMASIAPKHLRHKRDAQKIKKLKVNKPFMSVGATEVPVVNVKRKIKISGKINTPTSCYEVEGFYLQNTKERLDINIVANPKGGGCGQSLASRTYEVELGLPEGLKSIYITHQLTNHPEDEGMFAFNI